MKISVIVCRKLNEALKGTKFWHEKPEQEHYNYIYWTSRIIFHVEEIDLIKNNPQYHGDAPEGFVYWQTTEKEIE